MYQQTELAMFKCFRKSWYEIQYNTIYSITFHYIHTVMHFRVTTSAWSGPVRIRHFYIWAFRVPAVFCAYQHFWHVAGTQSKIVRVWMIRPYDPIYDKKWYRNYVKYTTQAGSSLVSTHHMNEHKSVYFIVWCARREVVSGETCRVVE